jgi:hypothetical protein
VTLAVGEMHVELRKGWQEFALTCGTPHDVLMSPPRVFDSRIEIQTALKRLQVARAALEESQVESMGLRFQVRRTIALARSTCLIRTRRTVNEESSRSCPSSSMPPTSSRKERTLRVIERGEPQESSTYSHP